MQKRQTDYVRVQLRMPPELHEAIVSFSSDENASMNSAILALLGKGLVSLKNEADTKKRSDLEGRIKKEVANMDVLFEQIKDFRQETKVYLEEIKKIASENGFD